jgi:hypothetical protein
MDYAQIPLPRKGDAVLVSLFWDAGYRAQQLQSLNRCRLALKMLFLLDMATACGRCLNTGFLVFLVAQDSRVSRFILPKESPSHKDWALWLEFWTAFSGPGWCLHIPLGPWSHPTHRQWEWFYDARGDLMIHAESDKEIVAYLKPDKSHRLWSRQVYIRSHALGQVPPHSLPANVAVLTGGQVLRREIGPPLVGLLPNYKTFWAFLQSLGGEWMWGHIVKGEARCQKAHFSLWPMARMTED